MKGNGSSNRTKGVIEDINSDNDEPDYLLIDEAHHSEADTYQLLFYKYPNAIKIGFSATPERLDGKGLDNSYQNIIISPAKWIITPSDFPEISKYNEEVINEWRKKLNLPEEVVISVGDNDLYINFSSKVLTEVLIREFSKKTPLILEEFLYNIMFKYDRHALRKTLDDVSIHIPKGKVTAIVGASGSGKTTLVKLMLGYYPVLEGHINIGGTDINTLNKKWWRRQCGVVMQDGVIFSESIARNIAVDDGDIDKERLLKAARIACIHDYVMSLPLKYNTKIGRDGVGLSQGQRQRILIARAVYKNPDYIFLDEATNSLDANNERAIVKNLDTFYRGKTVVIVAHRLSTVRNADQIVVIDHGKIVETGNHETLTAKRGAYYNLVKNQLELGN